MVFLSNFYLLQNRRNSSLNHTSEFGKLFTTPSLFIVSLLPDTLDFVLNVLLVKDDDDIIPLKNS